MKIGTSRIGTLCLWFFCWWKKSVDGFCHRWVFQYMVEIFSSFCRIGSHAVILCRNFINWATAHAGNSLFQIYQTKSYRNRYSKSVFGSVPILPSTEDCQQIVFEHHKVTIIRPISWYSVTDFVIRIPTFTILNRFA